MVTVSERARQELLESQTGRETSAVVRVRVVSGWSGPSLGLVLDEPKDGDRIFDSDGLKMAVEGGLLERLGAIDIDYRDTFWQRGFSVTAANTLEGSDHPCC